MIMGLVLGVAILKDSVDYLRLPPPALMRHGSGSPVEEVETARAGVAGAVGGGGGGSGGGGGGGGGVAASGANGATLCSRKGANVPDVGDDEV
jgi:uncharacterized membrane protein